jgi:hypothetical protein
LKDLEFDKFKKPIGLTDFQQKYVKAYEQIIVGYYSRGSELYTALGYDAMWVSGKDYWVILNRTKMTFADENGVIEFDRKYFTNLDEPSKKP